MLFADDGGDPAVGNVVAPFDPNNLDGGTIISNNGGAGIAVTGHGYGNRFEYLGRSVRNGGPFIDLGNDGPGNAPNGPNGGAQAPVVTAAWGGTSEGNIVQGLASPGATVSTYTAGPNIGGIGTFFATGDADGEGQFYLSLADPIGDFAVGDRAVATQTTQGGTSEISAPREILYGSPLFGPNQKPTKVPDSATRNKA